MKLFVSSNHLGPFQQARPYLRHNQTPVLFLGRSWLDQDTRPGDRVRVIRPARLEPGAMVLLGCPQNKAAVQRDSRGPHHGHATWPNVSCSCNLWRFHTRGPVQTS